MPLLHRLSPDKEHAYPREQARRAEARPQGDPPRRYGVGAALNSQQAALNSNLPALSFDDPVFTNRLHYRDGKSCHDVVSKELKEELPAPAPSADAVGRALESLRRCRSSFLGLVCVYIYKLTRTFPLMFNFAQNLQACQNPVQRRG